MNVFILDRDMERSAQMLDDAHLKSQINEACQILMANWNYFKYPSAKIGHLNHPVTKYYSHNYYELCQYLLFLLVEYKHRFRKDHQNLYWLYGFATAKFGNAFDYSVSLRTFNSCKTYVNGNMTDDIDEIRRYIATKPHRRPLTWTRREKPDWWKEYEKDGE